MRRGIPAHSRRRRSCPSAFAAARPCTQTARPLVAAAIATVALIGWSAAPSRAGVASEVVCQIASDGELPGRSHSSPLFDEALIDYQSFGRPGKVHGKGQPGLLAFTFDDGPNEETTPIVAAALDAYDIPATFFVVGWRLNAAKRGSEARRATLLDLAARGFYFGNHTYKHKNLRSMGERQVAEQIDSTADAIAGVLGSAPHAFRPPYGASSATVVAHLARRNMSQITWSIDTKDFHNDSAAHLRKRATREILAAGGGIVLLHDTKGRTAEAISGVLDDLEAENCRRLALNQSPILPVSLHYFMKNRDGSAAEVPALVRVRTARYRAALPTRCAARKPSY